MQEGHHEGDAAVHTFGASVRAVFVFAYLTVDDQHFIRRTGFDSGHDDQKQHKYDEHRDDGDDYAYARCGKQCVIKHFFFFSLNFYIGQTQSAFSVQLV